MDWWRQPHSPRHAGAAGIWAVLVRALDAQVLLGGTCWRQRGCAGLPTSPLPPPPVRLMVNYSPVADWKPRLVLNYTVSGTLHGLSKFPYLR
jgi:hypothetical protein